MQKEKVNINGLTLVGLTARTNNLNEINRDKSKIAELAGRYFQQQLGETILHRTHPGVTYAVYTDFESDEHGDYTYFIGEAVHATDGQDPAYHSIQIPGGTYQKFTTEPGQVPEVVINAWMQIWAMNEHDFQGKRAYQADFEVYDQRASDPDNAVLDIYIGINT